MSAKLVRELRSLADCDARSGEPLGKCMRIAADHIEAAEARAAELESERDEALLACAGRIPQSDVDAMRADYDHLSDKFNVVWADREDLHRRLSAAVEALKEARGQVEAWGQYASAYFQEKHDLPGAIAAIDAALVASERAEEQSR